MSDEEFSEHDDYEPRSRRGQSGRRGDFDRGDSGDASERGGRPRFGRRSRISPLYSDPNFRIDYKDPETLRRFITDHGKIRPRRQTGLYARDQRKLAREVKRARHLALLPFTGGHVRETTS